MTTNSYRQPFLRLLGAIAAGGLVTTATAQVGSGWLRFYPTSFLDVGSSGSHTHYDLVDDLVVDGIEYHNDTATGIETFKIVSTASNRIERENDEHYTSGKRQMEGDLMISSLSDQSVHQLFFGTTGPFYMAKGYGANGGELRKMGGSVVLASGINGVWMHYNQINDVGNTMEVYINGSLAWSGASTSGAGFNNKYGLYGTKTTTAPVVQWKNVKHYTGFTGYYRIMNRNSGKAVNVDAASTADGAHIIQWPYSSGSPTNDEWQIVDIGGGYVKILNRNSGKALNVENVSTADGAYIIQWTYSNNSSRNDEWQIVEIGGGFNKILNRNSGKALNVEGVSMADGARIIQWTYSNNSSTNDEWEIISIP